MNNTHLEYQTNSDDAIPTMLDPGIGRRMSNFSAWFLFRWHCFWQLSAQRALLFLMMNQYPRIQLLSTLEVTSTLSLGPILLPILAILSVSKMTLLLRDKRGQCFKTSAELTVFDKSLILLIVDKMNIIVTTCEVFSIFVSSKNRCSCISHSGSCKCSFWRHIVQIFTFIHQVFSWQEKWQQQGTFLAPGGWGSGSRALLLWVQHWWNSSHRIYDCQPGTDWWSDCQSREWPVQCDLWKQHSWFYQILVHWLSAVCFVDRTCCDCPGFSKWKHYLWK